jgi:hypothetical protein
MRAKATGIRFIFFKSGNPEVLRIRYDFYAVINQHLLRPFSAGELTSVYSREGGKPNKRFT